MDYSDTTTPSLVIQHTGQLIPLMRGTLTIGRAPDNGLVLADPQVSAYHAAVSWRADRRSFVVEDRGSTNGTYLNERRVAGTRTVRHGDLIRVGNTIMAAKLAAGGGAVGGEDTAAPAGQATPDFPVRNFLLPAAVAVLLAGITIACLLLSITLFLGSRKGVPTVTIQSPPDGANVVAGNEVILQAVASAAADITLIELQVDDGVVATATSADPAGTSSLVVIKPWFFATPGQHRVSAVAHTARGKTSRTESIDLLVLTSQP